MNKKYILNAAFALILLSAFFFGCNKDADNAIGIIPKDKLIQIGTNDTININAYTYRVDSVVSSGVSNVLLGSYSDPIFGDSKSEFVIQITPGTISGFGTNPVADSIVLSLRYSSDSLRPIYGNKSAPILFNAFEIGTKLYPDSNYYSNLDPTVLNLTNELANISFYPEDGRNDTTILDIQLAQSLGQRIIDNYGKWHDNTAPADTSFYDYFSGIYVKTNDMPYDGSLNTFSIMDPLSKAVLYYHNDTDTLTLSFGISQFSTRFNLFSHLHNSPGLPDLEHPENQQDSVVYLQGTGGLKVKLDFPGLDSIKKSGLWGVNRAELVFSAEDKLLTDEVNYQAPLSANLLRVADEGDELEFVDDYVGEKGYIAVAYNDNKYIFDITYTIQQILSGALKNNGFYLFPSSNYDNPSRVVLTGPKHSNKMKLILTLRKLD
jgi:hypothetical protein